MFGFYSECEKKPLDGLKYYLIHALKRAHQLAVQIGKNGTRETSQEAFISIQATDYSDLDQGLMVERERVCGLMVPYWLGRCQFFKNMY